MDAESTVFIIAGDSKSRRSLVVRMQGLQQSAVACRSADEFFDILDPAMVGCVLLAVSQPTADLDLLRQLAQPGNRLPLIVISPPGDVATAVLAMKLGAVDCLEESCSNSRLFDAIDEAMRWAAQHRRHINQTETIRRRLTRLDAGHRSVLDRIVVGKTNSEIAGELELSVRAIEVRRAKVMTTMRAKSLADLVRQTLIVEGVWMTRRTEVGE